MKLQNFIIGIGLFGLFTVIIFGMINNEGGDCLGIYCANYLNVSHDSNTTLAIQEVAKTGINVTADYENTRGDFDKFTSNRSASALPTEGNLLAEGIRTLMNLPNTYKPVTNGIRTLSNVVGIPTEFRQWAISSIVIIVILILLASFLKNKLQS